MSVVAMDMNTTTENSDSVSTPTVRPMLATMMPTSPRGLIPMPMIDADLLPIQCLGSLASTKTYRRSGYRSVEIRNLFITSLTINQPPLVCLSPSCYWQ